ncbi:hypothetical protein A2631_04170 [Candidatus Daviesbacteria bacterium RIFCSPHIGHO2_01_FULL_44_29]|uniref:Uncharacterized protein n=1 Tax=Candidatus Daviesbacteria bacterium RIFCSPHIGHO2_02_FULL_43_12 TaxID=1797776 RepID=A0A1F5KGF7_9BACT|nr:MAG: hypothetical protein A2631_04170 [Candidatus Daviesbacteria bacterium RIFCSPHIGHO2_01_FULL_44_29]OGE39924.1 MAG: hypothetical protein A3D25_03900 [Candidatus Daviesbacteria bacterium RIFCSPHIGHO2_02_FULL_43_12]OGE40518.1 MAG: hypothetical protein A3E86_00885 [Candidatus Daviesbacteria bacterium RIFCSPHIGHO2_12_FULL_47_45]OGE70395.1 MAG: hypothetical protein A3B55_01670 [Candidatus Daviesbacteria bacterium RIFCSPLOWO2_01_FULL_43_15]
MHCREDSRKDYLEKHQTIHTAEGVISAIKLFVKNNQRVPVKKELNRYYKPARKFYGTWNSAIQEAGFIPNPVLFSNHQIAKD